MNIRFSITKKIFLVILLPALVLVSVIYINYRNLDILGRSADRILSENYKSIKIALDIRKVLEDNMNRMLGETVGYSVIEQSSIPPYNDIQPLLNQCRENITEPGEKKIIDSLYKILTEYNGLLNSIKARSLPSGFPDDNISAILSLTKDFNVELDKLIAINERAMEKAESDTRRIAKDALRHSMGLLIAAIVFSIGLSLLLSVRISRPLANLARSLADVKEGSGNYPHIPIVSKDEIGFLSAEFNRLFERLKVYDNRSLEQLQFERMKVRNAEVAKARFIADLSHQLKTPMTSLSMSIGLLYEDQYQLPREKRDTLLRTAKEECNRLSALINELVDISKLENMVKPRQKEVLDIEHVIRETLRPLIYQAQEKGVELEIRFKPGIPPMAIDSLRFPWIFTNLVGNAIRYTERGGYIKLSAECRGKSCHFRCSDTGSGIPRAYLAGVFDRYVQFSEREKSGTIGLGLAIVKEIIEQHGGDISVESQADKGTTFRFWIPLGDMEGKDDENGADH